MIKVITSIALLTSALFASEGGETDIVARTINFAIFAGLLYYFIGDMVKNYFKGRSEGIQGELQKVQDRLKETKIAKQEAEKRVADAQKLATEILANSKKENALLSEKINEQMNQDLKSIEAQHESLIAFEQREMVGTVVEEIMEDVLSDSNIPLDNDVITDIMLKKVA